MTGELMKQINQLGNFCLGLTSVRKKDWFGGDTGDVCTCTYIQLNNKLEHGDYKNYQTIK